ncbi:2-oxoglutaramate amidase [Clostridium acetireducens DSM 10703]|jgi:omega-amidase|uniref:2-oxoglutaramate amidase n=1 Tax=Clostridium acetireducens DSM 10703 TaxID=1121290 RepID=A0A1E8F297_9CLOT|nr:carbon-nitrogen hydrolase family protein [Clostridium acetireducens]OFI07776.1 2-oxoglutaramate amidase [Clostridium acetireducens DSM 10703]
MKSLKVALCQMLIQKDKILNIEKAKKMILKASKKGAKIIALPEMFNCPYNNKCFRSYSESYLEGETINTLSNIAKEEKVYLIGGSIPEKDEKENIYNTCFIFDDNGKIIGKHRKIHLFDINIKDKIKFMESEVLSRGNDITIVDTKWGKIGVAICYDIRFPELIRIMSLKGAKMVFIPAAFNMTTGPAHWSTLFKSRALDNQIYMFGISPARNIESSYKAYGHSIISNPWGNIINEMDEKEGILIEDINLNLIEEIREQLPLIKHRRTDIYKLSVL